MAARPKFALDFPTHSLPPLGVPELQEQRGHEPSDGGDRAAGAFEWSDVLESLGEFQGPPSGFWPAFLPACGALFGASSGTLVMRGGSGSWQPVAQVPGPGGVLRDLGGGRGGDRSAALLPELATRADGGPVVVEPVRGGSGSGGVLVAMEVTPGASETVFVALLHLPRRSRAVAAADPNDGPGLAVRARLAREVASAYALRRRLGRVEHDIGAFGSVLDLLRVLDARPRFLEAAMTLCNEVASRFGCERVSLGWLEHGEVRLQAISHSEKFEKKAGAVRAVEGIMEEALDQDAEIAVPPVGDADDAVTRLHEEFSRSQSVEHLASLPLRSGGEPVGVLTLERSSTPFDEPSLLSLRLVCDQVVSRMVDRKRRDGWFGARWWTAVRAGAARLTGPEHTGWKLLGLAGAVGLAVLVFGRGTYRVEAPFILEADKLAQLPAAFDGYLQEVHFRVGDTVRAGVPLVQLDTRELLVQETEVLAEIRRHRSEVQRAETAGDLAEMRIAAALADEAEAKLESVRDKLARGLVAAPFDGVVIEGDLRERVGSPISQGEVLLTIARLDAMHLEGRVAEGDVHLLEAGAAGEVAFASQPKRKFPVKVERIEPLALPEEGGNVFIVRATFPGGAEPWWRPGMSGLCKIEAGRRSLLWMVTRRTVDFLRMRFWW